MTRHLYARQIRIFDYPKFAEPFRDRLRDNAERLAAANGIEIEFLRKRKVRKEDLVKAALAQARRTSRSGVHSFGDGAVLDLQAVARQGHR